MSRAGPYDIADESKGGGKGSSKGNNSGTGGKGYDSGTGGKGYDSGKGGKGYEKGKGEKGFEKGKNDIWFRSASVTTELSLLFKNTVRYAERLQEQLADLREEVGELFLQARTAEDVCTALLFGDFVMLH